jgi:hypothetical protein
LPEPPASKVDNTNVTSVLMEIDAVFPPRDLPFPGVTTCNKGFTVLPNTALDEEDISHDETVTTRGSNGPLPNTPVTQKIVRKLTVKFLIQSTEGIVVS